jgi:hypothetical protein
MELFMSQIFCLSSRYSWIALFAALLSGGIAQADLEFAETTADAGEVRAGSPLNHEFTFVNRGPEIAEITGMESSCGCLTPKLDRRSFPPGERGSIRLEVNTLSPAPGPHTWQVKLSCQTATGDTPMTTYRWQIPLRLTARLVREIVVEPAAVTMFVDGPMQSEIHIVDLRSQPIQIQEMATTAPGLQARLAGEERDSSGHLVRRVQLQVAGDFPEGRHEEFVSLFSDDPAYREIKVPVTIVKRSRQRLSATPGRIELTHRPGISLPTRTVLIRDKENQPVEVESVKADNPAITCRWAKGPGTMVTLRVQIDGDKIQDSIWETTLRIQVVKPTRQIILIPVILTGNQRIER